jgi:hypothetical protein
MLEPGIVHLGQTVAGIEDDVDAVLARISLSQPVGKGDLGVVTGSGEHVQRALEIARTQEDIEVLVSRTTPV